MWRLDARWKRPTVLFNLKLSHGIDNQRNHPDGTLTNREQLMLDSLRSVASFAEINSANEAAYAAELLEHLIDVDCDCQTAEREHVSRELADWHARQVETVDLTGCLSKATR
jgi:hypothetical protein